MLLISLSLLGTVVASSDSATMAVRQRISNRGYDELIENLAGLEGPMRGWLSPMEVALQMCNQFEETRAALSTLVVAGSFKDGLEDLANLYIYSPDWKDMFTSMPITAIIAWARGDIDMTIASRMMTLLTEYATRLNTECGFRYLPPSLQRYSHRVLGQSNPHDFRIVTEGLTDGQLAHFPDSLPSDGFTPFSATFGEISRGTQSWYYDVERSCTVVSNDPSMVLIPELRTAVAIPKQMTVLNQHSTITVWFPFRLASRGVQVPVGEIFALTDPYQIVKVEVSRLLMHGDDRHFIFHVTLEDEDVFSQLILFDVYNSSEFEEHPISRAVEEFEIDGGFALGVSSGNAVALVPNARFEGHYPDPQPRRIMKRDQYLVDMTFAAVAAIFSESMQVIEDDYNMDEWRDNPEFTDEQKQWLEVYECVNNETADTRKCQEAIAILLRGKPDSALGVETLFNEVFGYEDFYRLASLSYCPS